MRLLPQHAFLRETFRRVRVQGYLPLSYTISKRKRSTVADAIVEASIPFPHPITVLPQTSTRRSSRREDAPAMNATQPQISAIISRIAKQEDSDSLLSESLDVQSCEEETTIAERKDEETETPKRAAMLKRDKIESSTDPETNNEEDVQEALSRPPPVNSDYLPLPWKGRLGYVRVQR